MAIRIGEDGTIINGDEVIYSSGTVIRDDGNIESSNIASNPAPQRNYVSHAAPVSPLESGGNRQNQVAGTSQVPVAQSERGASPAATKSIADLEYDLMVAEGHARGAIPKTPLIVTIIMLFCGIAIHPIFLIGTVIAGIMAFMGFSKKSTHEEEVQRLRNEIEALKQQQRGGV